MQNVHWNAFRGAARDLRSSLYARLLRRELPRLKSSLRPSDERLVCELTELIELDLDVPTLLTDGVRDSLVYGLVEPILLALLTHASPNSPDCGRTEATALAIAVTAAGSSSGGESTHRCKGSISDVFLTAGVPGLGGISIAGVSPCLGEEALDGIFPRRLALANQLDICVFVSPVSSCSIRRSGSRGYGWF